MYCCLGPVAVSDRAQQIATLLTLLPYAAGDAVRIVELACGEGLLAAALLTAFPHARYLGLDGSKFPPPRPLASTSCTADWLAHADGAGVVASSLAVHHLPDAGKRALYHAPCPRLADHGALLLAGLVAPRAPKCRTCSLEAGTGRSMSRCDRCRMAQRE